MSWANRKKSVHNAHYVANWMKVVTNNRIGLKLTWQTFKVRKQTSYHTGMTNDEKIGPITFDFLASSTIIIYTDP